MTEEGGRRVVFSFTPATSASCWRSRFIPLGEKRRTISLLGWAWG